ncbi:hypothetical protein LZ554_000765 [Drepanopeziza brunnea f. sp. 'monogermtubi']|nr:hypothetical protein LZ554_000765 [Drepanopeziza brunnea f. sp. 'monogermtubi']
MASTIQLGLRAFQFLMILLTLSLIGNVIQGAFAGNSSSINYAMFVSVFDMVVILWGIGCAFRPDLGFGFGIVAADAVATLFTVIAGIVLAAKLHVHSCGNDSYILSNPLTNGSNNPRKRCHELQASTAFFWFAFAAFVGSLVMSFMSSGSSFKSPRASNNDFGV